MLPRRAAPSDSDGDGREEEAAPQTPAYGTFHATGGSRGGAGGAATDLQEGSKSPMKSTATVGEGAASSDAPEEDKADDGPGSLPRLHPESPETPLWRKLFFEFFNKSVMHQDLDASQVWELSTEHTSAAASSRFRKEFARCGYGYGRLKHAILRSNARQLAMCWGLQLASMLCDACMPVLLYALLAMSISGEYERHQIYMLLALVYVSSLAAMLLQRHSHFLGYKVNIKITGALRTLVFENTISQAQHSHAPDDSDGTGRKRMAEMAHLYAKDVVNVAHMVTHMQFMWRSVLQIIFELFILVQVIHISFQVIAIAFLCMGVVVLVGSRVENRLQRKLQTKVEARLNVIHECFKGIQMVKLNAWEDKMQEKIAHARSEENCERSKTKVMMAMQYCLGMDSPNLVSIFIFGWMALQDSNALSPARVFPALLLIRRIKEHFSNIVRLFDVTARGHASYSRIDRYLNDCNAQACTQMKKEEKRRCAGKGQRAAAGSRPDLAVAMERACLGGPDENGQALLLNVTFHVRRGQLAMIQGEAGSGKSTLVTAVLGDMPCLYGDVFVAGDCRVAYCAQEPWLQTLSIRENILFGSPFDLKKYWCVVEACCLVQDLRLLPDGDNTKVGPKGINLSGGQKARVALARACYADADIYVLDCPFASVDAVVQNEVFTKCIVELLRHKTVLMVTHNPELASSGFVDHMIRVEDHTVHVSSAEKGWAVDRYPAKRVDARNSLPPWKHVSKISGPAKTGAKMERGLALWEPSTYPASFTKGVSKASVSTVPTTTMVPVVSTSPTVAMPDCVVGSAMAAKFRWKEDWFSRKTWRTLLHTGNSMSFILPAKIFLLVYAVAGTFKDVWLMWWSGRAADIDLSSPAVLSDMAQSTNIYGSLVVGSMISGFVSSVLHAKCLSVSANAMFHDMTTALLHAPMSFFYSTPVGELFNRYFHDVRVLDTSFALSLVAMFRSAVTIIASDAILWYFTGIAGTSILLIVLYVVKEFMSLGFLVGLLQLSFRAESANLNFISEALDGSATIRAFGKAQVDRFRATHGVLSDELMKGRYQAEVFNNFVLIRCDRILGVHMLLLVVLLSMHDVSPPELGLMLYYVFTINSDVYTLSSRLLEVALCLLNVERVRKFGLIEPERQSYVGSPLATPTDWPRNGDVEFDHVSFSYTSDSDGAPFQFEKPALALRDVSFSVKGGEKVGVVGRTGSGKSSLAMALFRVHELTQGRILVDGLDVCRLGLSALRRNVCIIPQSPLFYRCSVRNYLDPFGEFTDAAMLDGLRQCGLQGSVLSLDAELADNGENWSLGERQMLCLARVVLRPSRVLVLDEAFSAVDQARQATLLRVLETAFQHSTIFLITHRLEDVLQFDKILVMQEGRAVEFGRAEDLAADPDSAFFEFLETTLLTY